MSLDYGNIWRRVKAGDFAALTDAEFYTVAAIGVAIVAAIVLFVVQSVGRPPPKKIVMSTGGEKGAYYAYGLRYKAVLARHGIELDVRTSNGSFENLERLRDAASGVSIALVQTGVNTDRPPRSPDQDEDTSLQSLASVAFEPMWVFHRAKERGTMLANLRGKRIAIGPRGSGAHFAAMVLLKANSIDASNSTLLELAPDQGLTQLKSGDVDALIAVAAASAPIIEDALSNNFNLVDFTQADAYIRRFTWLSKITLPMGGINLAANLPSSDVTLIAASANLVVRDDLHPSIAYILLDAATEVHAQGTLFNAPKAFPAEQWLEFPQSDESVRYFKTGKPFLQRYLPFWIANLVERLSVSLLPVLAVLLPLLKGIASFFGWRAQARFARLYDDIKRFESRAAVDPTARGEAGERIASFEQRLDGFKLQSTQLSNYYDVRGHLDSLKARYI